MQFLDRINAIEARLGVINLTLWQLCRDAKVDYGTVQRWRNGETSPLARTLEKHLGALEAALTRAEQSIVKKLKKPKRRRHSSAAARAGV